MVKMKTTFVLISLSYICLINAAPLKRTRGPKTTTTDAGFVAKYFHIPEFLKFSRDEKTTESKVNTVELLATKSRLSKVLDKINIFKKSNPLDEPYLRAYMQPDGSYKWYFVYPGQMLYPAPEEFSFDALNQALKKTTPTTTTTTTTTTEPPPEELDDTPKPLYPLMGKIEFVKNETKPKENEWAITLSNSGPIFEPFGKIQPPFDEPFLQQLHQNNDQDDQEPQEEPVDENQSVTSRKRRTYTKTPKPIEEEEPAEDDQPEDEPQEEAQEENQPAYDNPEPEENVPSADENIPDEANPPQQDEDEQPVEDDAPPVEERTPEKRAKSPKPSAA